MLFTDGYAASAPLLHRAVQAFGSEDLTMDEASHSAWIAAVAAADLWDDEHWDVLSRRHLDVIRREGALSVLPLALTNRAIFEIHSGDLAAAASLLAERHWVAEVTGGRASADTHARGVAGRHAGPRRGGRAADPGHRGRRVRPRSRRAA